MDFHDVVRKQMTVLQASKNLNPLMVKEKFISKYAISLEMPATYVFSATFYRRDPRYIVLALKSTFPDELRVFDFMKVGTLSDPSDEDYKHKMLDEGKSLCFRVLHDNKGEYNLINQRLTDSQFYKKMVLGMYGEDGSRIALVRSDTNSVSNPFKKEFNLQVSKNKKSSQNEIDVFDCSSIEFFLDKSPITPNDPRKLMTIKNSNFSKFNKHRNIRMKFSQTSKYLILIYGQSVFQIFDLYAVREEYQKGHHENKALFEKSLPSVFENLIDIFIDEQTFSKSLLVFKRKDEDIIDVVSQEWIENYDTHYYSDDKERVHMLSRTYYNHSLTVQDSISCDHMIVALSQNKEALIFSSGERTHILNLQKHQGEFQQRLIQHLEGKKVRYIQEYQNQDFLFFTADPTDQQISIRKGFDSAFKARMETRYSEQSVHIRDVLQMQDGSQKIILSKDDEEFLIYTLNKDYTLDWQKFYTCSLYAFQWPYLCYLMGNSEIIIQNTFSTSTAFVLRPPMDESSQVSHIYLNYELDLYVCISREDRYEIYEYDLDNLQDIIISTGSSTAPSDLQGISTLIIKKYLQDHQMPLYTIKKSQLEFRNIYKFMIKSHSYQELTKVNKERLFFIRYKFQMYKYKSDGTLEFVDNCTRLREISRNLLLYFSKGTTDQIRFMQFYFSDYRIGQVYEEVEGKIEDFQASDTTILIMVKGTSNNRDSRLLKIIPLVGNNAQLGVMKQIEVTDREFIGNFITTEAFANSIVASQNKAFFVITSMKTPKIHKYEKVIPLKEGERIQFESPKVNVFFRKMLYFKVNLNNFESKTCIILPYLNENHFTFHQRENTEHINTFSYYKIFKDEYKERKLAIISVFPTLSQALLFTIKGQLKHIVDLKALYHEVGEKIVCISNNGNSYCHLSQDGKTLTLLLIKCTNQLEEEESLEPTQLNLIHSKSCSNYRTQPKFTQPFLKVYKQYILDLSKVRINEEFFVNVKGYKTVFEVINYYQARNCSTQFKINLEQDLAIGFIYPAQPTDQTLLKDVLIIKRGRDEAFFARMPQITKESIQLGLQMAIQKTTSGFTRLDQTLLKKTKILSGEEESFEQSNHLLNCKDFKIMDNYLIAWSDQCIYYQDISISNSSTGVVELKKTRFEIAPYTVSGENAWIRSIHCPGNQVYEEHSKKFFIGIKIYVDQRVVVMKYNLLRDKEFSCFDTTASAQIFFDNQNKFYVIDDYYIQNLNTGIPLYYYNISMKDLQKDGRRELYLTKGSRFCESKTNPKFLIQNRFYMPFSYQILMLMIEKKGYELNEDNYDPGAIYSYNGNTALHTFATDFDQLSFVIQQYEKTDPSLTSMLLMKNNKEKTVLETSLEDQNSRCVNLVLEKIGSIQMNNIHSIKTYAAELLEYNGFGKYLALCFFQSMQMRQKTVLKISTIDPKTGFAIRGTRTSFLDQEFYDMFCPAHKEASSCSVIVNAIDAGWILKEKDGEEFLQALSETDDISYFDISIVKIIILFLWKHYKPLIIFRLFLPFLGNFLLFNFYALVTFPLVRDSQHWDNIEAEKQASDEELAAFKFYQIVNLLNMFMLLIFTSYIVYIEVKQLQFHREQYFKSFWNLLDCIAATLTPTIVLLDLTNIISDTYIRPLQAILVLIFHLRFFYFLRIFDSSASFVRIIVEITFDIQIFIFVLFIGVAGFGFAFYILSMNSPENQFIDGVVNSLLYSYQLTVGEFGTDTFDDSQNPALLWTLFILASLFTLIILLNMLVAIMGDSFNRVRESEESQRFREHLQLIVENDFLIRNRREMFRDVKYLIAIQHDRDDTKKNEMQRQMDFILSKMQSKMRKNKQVLETLVKNQEQQFNALRNMLKRTQRSNDPQYQTTDSMTHGEIQFEREQSGISP